jgi:hypothetical protein
MALTQIDFSYVVSGNSTLAGNGADEVAGLHPIARSDGHEEASHLSASSGTAPR